MQIIEYATGFNDINPKELSGKRVMHFTRTWGKGYRDFNGICRANGVTDAQTGTLVTFDKIVSYTVEE